MRKYMHAQMIAYYIVRNLKMKFHVRYVVCQYGRKKRNSEEVRDGVPSKLLWYIPQIPRFLRLSRNPEHAKNLKWHANKRIDDGKLRHPADSLA